MEVGKGQQAQARTNLGGRTPDSSDTEQDSTPLRIIDAEHAG